jgi:hypothetical protein
MRRAPQLVSEVVPGVAASVAQLAAATDERSPRVLAGLWREEQRKAGTERETHSQPGGENDGAVASVRQR